RILCYDSNIGYKFMIVSRLRTFAALRMTRLDLALKDHLMKINMQEKLKKGRVARFSLISSGVILCLLLLSACGTISGKAASTTATTPVAPVIDSTLKNQGNTQLQAFQQWIALMQQYNGDTSAYRQVYNADQQALNDARTSAAYEAALAKLNAHVQTIEIP